MTDHNRAVFVISTFLSIERLVAAIPLARFRSDSQRQLIYLPLPYLPYDAAAARRYLSAQVYSRLDQPTIRAYQLALRHTKGHPRSIARLLNQVERISPLHRSSFEDLVRWDSQFYDLPAQMWLINTLHFKYPPKHLPSLSYSQLFAITQQASTQSFDALTPELVLLVATGTPLRANATVPITRVVPATGNQEIIQVPLVHLTHFEGFLLTEPSSRQGESQLGMLPCHLFAWANSPKVRLLTAT